VADQGEGWKFNFPAFEELAESASLTGLTDEHKRLMRRKVTPHPFGTYEQPLHLNHGGWESGSFERVLIACDDFRRLLAMNLPALSFVTDPVWRVEELQTGHWPMLSMPKELAELLME
jgi:hypothetical protein